MNNVTVIAFPAKTVYVTAFFVGAAVMASYSIGKAIGMYKAREEKKS